MGTMALFVAFIFRYFQIAIRGASIPTANVEEWTTEEFLSKWAEQFESLVVKAQKALDPETSIVRKIRKLRLLKRCVFQPGNGPSPALTKGQARKRTKLAFVVNLFAVSA